MKFVDVRMVQSDMMANNENVSYVYAWEILLKTIKQFKKFHPVKMSLV